LPRESWQLRRRRMRSRAGRLRPRWFSARSRMRTTLGTDASYVVSSGNRVGESGRFCESQVGIVVGKRFA